MFLIAGNLDCGEISLEAAAVSSAFNFAIMAWSGFSSGLLAVSDKKENLTIINRKIKNISPEKRQELLEMARVMFEKDFND